ncbi:GH1 family beta-glucosidase [Terriglobus roseus]|uniref:Beta-glucosidase n=1 Tax=Terriglobus roseus TaxID=392734 RepID=A0A1G7M580_9BACT|nr:GH1 family beta-glucosidase [Terriglobus roseus]SDF56927.1 beta-glucosidase [Terriglobus roseus]
MPYRISRRGFGKLAGIFAAASASPLRLFAEMGHSQSTARAAGLHFPKGFLWGSATASYQVEGAVNEDGRGPSIWDTFSHTAGKTHNGDTGDVSTDSYHRYAEDIALMKDLGLKTCRFSVAWSRIFPTGSGQVNQKGIDHYRKFCEALRAAGIEPYCTLYHWDLPQALEDKGGWRNHDTAKIFADYAGYTAGKLSDLCSNFMTMNEIWTFVELGYGNGVHAPGLKLSRGELAQVRHHAVLGHGLSVGAVRAAAPKAKVGQAENLSAIVPVYDSPEQVAAARQAMVEQNAGYLTVMRTGKYTDHYLKTLGADAPKFTPEEMKAIGSPLDFQGLNIYTATYARAVNNEVGYDIVGAPASYPHMESPWLTIGPDALYWAPKLVHEAFGVNEIYITENGCSSADVLAGDGHIYDTDRVMYLRNYLMHLQRAVSEGIPVKGYFLWSLLDNYEWADGYDKRFGITYVDFKTQKRTPKLSSDFYKNVIAKNSL